MGSHRSKKGNVCKSKHLGFRAPRAAAEKKSTRALGAPPDPITKPSDPITKPSDPLPKFLFGTMQVSNTITNLNYDNNSRCSKKGNVCKSKHLGFRAPRALVDFFFCSGPGAYGLENFATAEASPFGGQTSALGRALDLCLAARQSGPAHGDGCSK